MVTLIVRKQLGEDVRVILDVENYRQRRESSLRDMAAKVATRVAQTNRSITLEPMSPADRRVIHTSLSENPEVRTESAGEGDNRKSPSCPAGTSRERHGAWPYLKGRAGEPMPAFRGFGWSLRFYTPLHSF